MSPLQRQFLLSTTLRKTDSGPSSVPHALPCTDSFISLSFLLGQEDPRAKTIFVLRILCETWIRYRMYVKWAFGHLIVVQLPSCMDSSRPHGLQHARLPCPSPSPGVCSDSPQAPPSRPLSPSLHSQQQPSCRDCSTIPPLQLPATAPSRGPASLSRVCMAATRTVWFSDQLLYSQP